MVYHIECHAQVASSPLFARESSMSPLAKLFSLTLLPGLLIGCGDDPTSTSAEGQVAPVAENQATENPDAPPAQNEQDMAQEKDDKRPREEADVEPVTDPVPSDECEAFCTHNCGILTDIPCGDYEDRNAMFQNAETCAEHCLVRCDHSRASYKVRDCFDVEDCEAFFSCVDSVVGIPERKPPQERDPELEAEAAL